MSTRQSKSPGRGPRRSGRSGSGRGGRGDRGGGGRREPKGPVEELHPTEEPPDIESFAEWDLGDAIQAVIAGMGIEVPTPIQKLAIQPVLDGRDVIAKAETGTGKTLAFGAPMMARIDAGRATVLGLVLCPTRELAQQVAGVLEELGEPRGIGIALVVGGDPMHPQIDALKTGAQVVVGTPGRVIDLYDQGFLSFPWTEFVVLDEADEMLEIGFLDDVKKILSFTPEERQTLLFSATFPPDLLRLAREHTSEPVEVATARGVASVKTIRHEWVPVDDADRPLALIRLIEQSEPDDVLLVFCERRTEVDQLMRRLERIPYSIKALHGGYDQASRFRVMSAFRTGEVKALVATDVASRGLDVAHVTHVINYSVPRAITDYTHRSGRTGRAGRSGHAITFVTPVHKRRWQDILRRATWPMEQIELPERSRGGRPQRRDGGRERDRGGRGGGGSSARRGRGDGESRGRRRGERGERGGRDERPRRSRDESPERAGPSSRDGRERRTDGEPRGGRVPATPPPGFGRGIDEKTLREEREEPPAPERPQRKDGRKRAKEEPARPRDEDHPSGFGAGI